MDKVEQIRRAHAQAMPTQANPAWKNSHHDCGVLLDEIAHIKEKLQAHKRKYVKGLARHTVACQLQNVRTLAVTEAARALNDAHNDVLCDDITHLFEALEAALDDMSVSETGNDNHG